MVNMSLIPVCISDASLPKRKLEIVRYAQKHCSKDEVRALKQLPKKKYHNKIELAADLGNMPAKLLDAGERAIRESWQAGKDNWKELR